MSEFSGGWLIGLVVGFGIGAWLLLMADSEFEPVRKAYNVGKTLIAQCEATLPRNESCELIARKKGM